MNFSTKSMLALTAWITLIVASVVKPDAKVFQDILQLAIYGSYLLAICIGMITSRRSVRDYCVGFVVVGLGLSLLTRYAAVNVEHITIALANVFGNHADSNFYDFSRLSAVVRDVFLHFAGLIAGVFTQRFGQQQPEQMNE